MVTIRGKGSPNRASGPSPAPLIDGAVFAPRNSGAVHLFSAIAVPICPGPVPVGCSSRDTPAVSALAGTLEFLGGPVGQALPSVPGRNTAPVGYTYCRLPLV